MRTIYSLSISLIVFFALPATAQFEYAGIPVTSIEFEADSAFDPEPLARLVKIELGEPLSIVDLQSSIKALFGTGSFRDVRVDAERTGNGLAITFRLSLQYRVSSLDYEVDGELLDSIMREAGVEVEQILSLDRIDQAAVDMVREYERNGYLEATVDPEVQFVRQENIANVIFHVASGPRAQIASINLDGSTEPFSRDTLEQQMESEVGGFYELGRAREDARRMRRFLVRQDHRMAEVRFVDAVYDSTSASVALQYELEVGPVVEVVVEGVERKAVRRLIPFAKDDGYSEDRVIRAADRIQDHYQRRGFYFVEVETAEQLRGDRYVITYEIEPGEKFELETVSFDGNVHFTDDELRDIVSAGPPGVVQQLLGTIIRRPGGVTAEQLSDDQEALENFYRLEGFWSADIGRPRVVRQDEGELEVVFPVNEGTQTLVETVSVAGADKMEEELPELLLTPGEPFNPQELNLDLVTLQTFYADRGYIEIQVTPELEWNQDRSLASVQYDIIEGPLVRFGTVVVRGNTYTDTDVILGKARIESGEPFSYRALLEAQQRLYRLGIFRLVDMDPVSSGTAEHVRDILLRIEEGTNLTVTGSVGYSTDDGARGSAAVAHRNLFGTGRYLGLETTISQRLNRYVMNYREPFILGYDLPTQVTFFKEDELRADEKAVIESLGTSIEMTRIVRDQFRWALRYEYRLNECVSGELCELATGAIPIEGLDPEDQEIEISSITPSVFWDRRNDAVNPSEGFYVGSSLEYAFPLYSAETNFLKGYLQSTVYFPLSESTQIVTSVRLGAIESLVDSGSGSFVPFAERFLSGGEASHRGFDHDRLGVPCETLIVPNLPEGVSCSEYVEGREDVDFIPVGGNGLVLFNVEYRFPIFGALMGAVFVDGGNVWRDYGSIDFSEMRYATGAGLRYLTPVGPLRFDVGYKLDPEPWEDTIETFLTLGYGF